MTCQHLALQCPAYSAWFRMKKVSSKHDTLVDRISGILSYLYQGEQIDRPWLCERFHITERTAYRDLSRLSHLLEEMPSGSGKYQLAASLQPQLHVNELRSFSAFADVAKLFPNSTGPQLKEFVKNNEHNQIKGHSSRDNSKLGRIIQQLNVAITQQTVIAYTYRNKVRQAEPYKLINQSGLWYLVAFEGEQLKSFEVAKIEHFSASEQRFDKRPHVIDELENASGISFGTKQLITLHVSPTVAEFVTRRPLFPEQNLLNKLPDGSLHISTTVTEPQYLFRWLRYWLPEIKIISPESLAQRFMDDIEQKLHKITTSIWDVQV